ncbi:MULTISPECIES: hypothetical protein [unclassified Kitasatospora]|uniref:hypothetical protein n=1 Tax=unclassified Kitasatospora TaxID=2633591 RepID=UPI001ADEE9EE|nr:hypothetical protein [Kitasatospora sp. RG8]MBP0449363.1 hypothetical protein [Kitasatospora sp. RG8]
MTAEETTMVAVGVRSVAEVFAALEAVNSRRQPWTRYEHGVLGAYRWAVGTQVGAPVTASAAVGAAGPCRAQLLAEFQAAAVQIRAGAGRGVDADYALGAYGALAWLCGHHEELP